MPTTFNNRKVGKQTPFQKTTKQGTTINKQNISNGKTTNRGYNKFVQFKFYSLLLMLSLYTAVMFTAVTDVVPVMECSAYDTRYAVTRSLPYDINAVFVNEMQGEIKQAIHTNACMNAAEKRVASEKEIKEIINAEKFYIPDIVLDYEHEHIKFEYDLQKYLWEQCEEVGVDYFLVMGMIARESRFDKEVVSSTDGVTYYGLMQIAMNSSYGIQDILGVEEYKDIADPYGNIWVGVRLLRYCIDTVGSEQGGVMAYGTGVQGYYDNVARGIYTNSDVEKAYKFRRLLMGNTLYSFEKDGQL